MGARRHSLVALIPKHIQLWPSPPFGITLFFQELQHLVMLSVALLGALPVPKVIGAKPLCTSVIRTESVERYAKSVVDSERPVRERRYPSQSLHTRMAA